MGWPRPSKHFHQSRIRKVVRSRQEKRVPVMKRSPCSCSGDSHSTQGRSYRVRGRVPVICWVQFGAKLSKLSGPPSRNAMICCFVVCCSHICRTQALFYPSAPKIKTITLHSFLGASISKNIRPPTYSSAEMFSTHAPAGPLRFHRNRRHSPGHEYSGTR